MTAKNASLNPSPTLCNAKRIVIDLSHLNEKGFWDVARLSSAPLVASHSNAHALTPSSRNLTDDQLRAIGKSGGIIGLNFAIDFLQNDGRLVETISPSVMIASTPTSAPKPLLVL